MHPTLWETPVLTIVQIDAPEDVDAVRALVRDFTRWAFKMEPDAEAAPTFDDLEGELASLPGIYGPPTGCFLLARDAGEPVGCIAFRAHGPGTVELKRMYVRPEARGQGVGEALVAALIAEARRRGCRQIVLDSHHSLKSAQRIYRAAGFREVAAPLGFPEQWLDRVVFMELHLV